MAHSISLPPSFSTASKPLRLSSLSSQAYVLSIVSLQAQYAASASAPANRIDIFDKSTLRCVQTLPGHEVATTALRAVNRIGESHKISLMSSGKDGRICVWDERTNSHGISMTNAGNHQPLLCFDVSSDGMTVAAGTDLQGEDALIHYWDPRSPSAPLRTHSSTHSDDITSLSFSSSMTDKIVLSGSSDGLISLSNPEEDDDDEAVLHVANWGCSVSQAGWTTGEGGTKIWAASDMETFSTWTNELDSLLNIDIRQPSVHSHGRTWVTDYLVTCHTESTSPSSLGVFVGSNEGDAALLTHPDLRNASSSWTIHKQWSNGHIGIVRALLWDNENNVVVTGGEDAKINVWSGFGDLRGSAMDTDITFSPGSRKREMDWEMIDWEAEEQEGKRARR